ncbi:DL-glycerol-3-phosphatase [Coemansia sp. RSA 2523]|nr:DL-glycerol-3-phosphatase [Coemansia sp. RSA 1824]KAJ1778008.1 DL-glycerol-3-phosphatase [Coemansia sp. RSA 1938]KAJ1802141.1 DL-glycerol-3-phosphatase [Coemansia sp. RSA 2523]KAJ2134978.1 DL-glycerol-3-phosphatase [Coemansia sp. RSA 788]KAJ2177166.1 DL-glycerol-3-phosphatase [Coemansia sp. RSA 530]KAJ2197082.1 DL-glycerol-3-phosphatase [Coemansia sp. RSA 522]KAJ2206148.1 DL-glycerol-3-phosphatase [Coemansia sp. RSA 521]KAJ2225025.1 DL-glycerol-3-phosphatase [Coemansia sp. RSA 518]KAJ227
MVEFTVKGVLFDMDGTLVDTTQCVEQAWHALAVSHNMDGDALLKHVHGRPCLDTLKAHFPVSCHTPEYAHEFELRIVNNTDGVHVVPGALRAVQSLEHNKWAVVTAASRMWATMRMQQAGLPLPKCMVSCDDITRGKPHPEGFETGAKCLGCDPRDVVVFEDAVNGVVAARAAGATVVALSTSTTADALLSAGAHYVVRDFTQVHIADDGANIVVHISQ